MAEEYGKNGCDNSLKGRGGAPAATEKAREAILTILFSHLLSPDPRSGP